MGKKSALKNNFKKSPNPVALSRPQKKQIFLPIFLAMWLLSKIGQFSVIIFTAYFRNLKILFSLISNFLRPPKPAFKLKLFTIRPKRHRGRPRIQPLHIFWLKKTKKFFRIIFPTPLRVAAALGVLLIGLFFYSIFLIVIARDLPSPNSLSNSLSPQTTEFFDRKGRLLYRFYEGKNRTPVKIADIPPDLIHATIAIEDKNFYAHPGIDIYGILRSAGAILQHHDVQGGSTITQQLIKNTILTPERTVQRKVKEILIAFWAEKVFSKNDILQMYFNEVPYGGPAWGVFAAAQTYFGKNVQDLNLAEASYLAGLPASPTTYSPYGSNPELGKARQKEVLRRMTEDGYISHDQAEVAYNQPLEIKASVSQIKAPHFVLYVRSLLASRYGEKLISQGGLKIYTTLDLDIQQMAEKIVADEVANLGKLDVSNGAAMVTDAKTGQILAMVGSKDYWDPKGGNFNVALARRQPGSSIKPITYATGFKMGFSPGSVILDAPVSYQNAWEKYAPVNYDGKFHGPVTVRTALGSSYNVPAVKMLANVGLDNMLKTARDLGITTFDTPDRYGLSLTLGGGEVKLEEMMAAYGVFAQLGIKHDIQPILKIVDSNLATLEDNTVADGVKVLDPGVAYLITDILSDNKARTPAFGPNSLLNIPNHPHVPVKTGTTDNKRDNWTFGYTPEFVVGVWVGNNDNHPMNPALTSGITGAAPIWNKIMVQLLVNRPDLAFERPTNVTAGLVDGHQDLIVSGITSQGLAALRPTIKPSAGNVSFTDPLSTYEADQTGHIQIVR